MNAASLVVYIVVGILTSSLLFVGLAVGARRLLGLRLGVMRTVLAGLVGSAAWLTFGITTVTPFVRRGGTPLVLTTVQAGIALLVAMAFLALAEAVLPSGSVRPLAWARALRHQLDRVRRYVQISQIAARHGLLGHLRGRRRLQADTPAGRAALARSVRLALEEGGVSFVKLGQLLATPEATLAQLAPGFDTVGESRAFAAAQLTRQLQPTSLRQAASDELPTLLPVLRRLPHRADRITSALEHGRLGLGMRLFADPRDRRFLTTLVHQILLAFLGATTGIMAVVLLASTGRPNLSPTLSLLHLLGYNLLVVSAVLILRVLVTIFRPPR